MEMRVSSIKTLQKDKRNENLNIIKLFMVNNTLSITNALIHSINITSFIGNQHIVLRQNHYTPPPLTTSSFLGLSGSIQRV